MPALRRVSCAGWWTVLLTLLASGSLGAQTYTVTDLGSLGTFETFSFAISDSSRAAGYSYVAANPGFVRHAFLWINGQMTDLGTLVPGGYSWANDINEVGQVCGFADVAGGAAHPFLWANGSLQDLGTPGDSGEARGLNNPGEVVGYFITPSGDFKASYWTAGSGFVDLTAATGGTQGLAEDLNDHGQVVGWSLPAVACGGPGGLIGPRPTLWEKSGASWGTTDLGTLGTSCFGHAYDVNELGVVVGESGGIASASPVKWQKSGGVWQIASLGSLGGTAGVAYAVNNRIQIVGQAQIAGGTYHAFLWQCNSLVDLNSRIPAGSGWVLTAATGINDLGEITGYGKLNGGNFRGFLLKPSVATCCGLRLPIDPTATE